MKSFRRTFAFLVGLLAAPFGLFVWHDHGRAAAPATPDYYSPLEAFGDVCTKSADHGEMLRKVRATGWETLKGGAVPALVRGNDMVQFAEVRRGQIAGQSVMLTVGDLGGTSFCRVYFPAADTAAMQKQLRYVKVLGAPLSLPDFNGPMNFPEGWSAVGWHRSVGDQWRAVHYSFDPDGHGPNAAWQSIEITRQT